MVECRNVGMQDSDIELAKGLVEQDKKEKKILELPMLIETETLEGRFEGKYRTINVKVPSLIVLNSIEICWKVVASRFKLMLLTC